MGKRATTTENNPPKTRTLFDHVKHIRQVQSPSYYTDLSDEDKKTFVHFMILRALSMDPDIVEDMAELYKLVDSVPSAQFYRLLIAIVPKSYKYYPWIKSKSLRHNKRLVEYVAKRFMVSCRQANTYINILLHTEKGQEELGNILKAFGLSDDEINAMIDESGND